MLQSKKIWRRCVKLHKKKGIKNGCISGTPCGALEQVWHCLAEPLPACARHKFWLHSSNPFIQGMTRQLSGLEVELELSETGKAELAP